MLVGIVEHALGDGRQGGHGTNRAEQLRHGIGEKIEARYLFGWRFPTHLELLKGWGRSE